MGLKKLKIKIIKKRGKKKMEEEIKKKNKQTNNNNNKTNRKTPQNCKSPTQRQRFIATIKNVTEYKHILIHP